MVLRLNLRQRYKVFAVLVFCCAALLRIGLVNRQGLWADELFSLALATGHSVEHPAGEADPALGDYVEHPMPLPASKYQRYMWLEAPPAGAGGVLRAVLLSDTNPPLYYLLLKQWMRAWGTSDASLHGFSVAWALACIPVLWFVGRQIGGRCTALIVCILFAVAPQSLYYSTEGRMYSILWFFSVSILWSTLALNRWGPRRRLLVLWMLSGAAGFLTHYFFSFVWLTCAAWLLVCPGQCPRGRVGVGTLLTGLITLPWYAHLPESLSRWRVTADWLYGFPSWRVALTAPFHRVWDLVSGNGFWGWSTWGKPVVIVVFGLALVRLWWARHSSRRSSSRQWLLYSSVFAACASPLLFDYLKNTASITVPRYTLAGMPAAFLLAGLGLSKCRGRIATVGIVLIVAAWSPGIRGVYAHHSRMGEPFKELGRILVADTRPDDVIIVHSIPSGVLGIARYLRPDMMMASWVSELKQRHVPGDIEAMAAGRHRVILVKIHDVGEPAPEEDWLRRNATLINESQNESAQILYFVPRDGQRFALRARQDR